MILNTKFNIDSTPYAIGKYGKPIQVEIDRIYISIGHTNKKAKYIIEYEVSLYGKSVMIREENLFRSIEELTQYKAKGEQS